MTASPFDARWLYREAGLGVVAVRCPADPPRLGPTEIPATIEIVFPLRGAFVRHGRRGEQPIVADAAVAVVARPGADYRVAHPAGGDDRSAAVVVAPEAAEDLVGDPERLPDVVATGPRLDRFLRRWLRAATDGTLDPLGIAEGAVVLLDATLRPPARPVASDPLVDAVRLELTTTLGETVSLAALGRRVGSSPYHLARRFRAATGTSIHSWRTTLRVREALARVDEGERDLTALALDLGFAHHSHLTNTVRRVTGLPPSAARRAPTRAELAALRTIVQAEAQATT